MTAVRRRWHQWLWKRRVGRRLMRGEEHLVRLGEVDDYWRWHGK